MDQPGEPLPRQIEGVREQAISEIERYILAYASAAYGALYASDPDFREDVGQGANNIIGNAMKMAVRHLELVQQLRIEVDEKQEAAEG